VQVKQIHENKLPNFKDMQVPYISDCVVEENEAMIPTYVCKEICCKIMPMYSAHKQFLPNKTYNNTYF
jgi:hypothetical protein